LEREVALALGLTLEVRGGEVKRGMGVDKERK